MIPYLAILAIAIGLGFVPLTILRMLRPRHEVGEVVCARCGYPIAGLAEARCPECGGDEWTLSRGPLGPRSFLLISIASIASAALAIVVVGVLVAVVGPLLPNSWEMTRTWRLGEPASGAYEEIVVTGRTYEWTSDQPRHGQPRTFDVSVKTFGGVQHELQLTSHDEFAARLFDWFRQLGLSGDEEALEAEAAFIARGLGAGLDPEFISEQLRRSRIGADGEPTFGPRNLSWSSRSLTEGPYKLGVLLLAGLAAVGAIWLTVRAARSPSHSHRTGSIPSEGSS